MAVTDLAFSAFYALTMRKTMRGERCIISGSCSFAPSGAMRSVIVHLRLNRPLLYLILLCPVRPAGPEPYAPAPSRKVSNASAKLLLTSYGGS